MNLKKIVCFMTAAVLSAATFMSVSAADDSSKVVEPYKADESMLTTDTSSPTLSFDMTDWTKYIHNTKDAGLINIDTKQEKTYAYQGATLKISGGTDTDIEQYCAYASAVRDADGNLAYPDAADAEYVTMGVELLASDFGMNYFDGCMVTFEYRINQEVQGKLMDDSVYVFPCDDDYQTLANNPLQLQINNTDNNNVTQFSKAVTSVGESVGATKLVVQVPLLKTCDNTDILYIDNITIVTPTQSNGEDLQVANLDGYNSNAKPQEIVQGLEVKAQENGLSSADTSEAESGTNTKTIIVFVGAGVLAAAVVVFVIIMVKKQKNKFY